jgi:hypothetical protein
MKEMPLGASSVLHDYNAFVWKQRADLRTFLKVVQYVLTVKQRSTLYVVECSQDEDDSVDRQAYSGPAIPSLPVRDEQSGSADALPGATAECSTECLCKMWLGFPGTYKGA